MALNPALFAAAAFLLFLLAAEPHRVHHTFDEHAAPSCPVYALAKGCQAIAAAPAAPHATPVLIAVVVPIPDIWSPRTLPAPVSQRAPPGV